MCDFSQYGGASDEWRAVEATLAPLPTDLSPTQLRTLVNGEREKRARTELQASSVADEVRQQDFTIPTRDGSSLEARTYRPVATVSADEALPLFIHLHGGGFLFGTVATEDAICALIAARARVVVLNVNYRHTPEHTYPTAWHDVQDAFGWAHANMAALGAVDDRKVVVGGISAGAQLTASLVLLQNLGRVGGSLPRIAGQVLTVPCLVSPDCYGPQLAQMRDRSVSSYVENAEAPLLPVSRVREFMRLLDIERAGELDPYDLRLNPGNVSAEQVVGLPPTTLAIAGLDPLRDEGLLFAKKLAEAGVPTDTHLFKGVPHAFIGYRRELTAARKWAEVVVHGITWALGAPVATGKFEVKVY